MLVVGADAGRLGRLAGHLVGATGDVSLEFLGSREAALDRLSTPDVDCIAYEVVSGACPCDEVRTALHEAVRSVPVVLFGDDRSAFESVDVEAADAVAVGPGARGADELLASVEAAVGDGRRPGRSVAWYEALLESTSDAVLVLTDEGVVEYASPPVRHVLGYEPEAIVGESVFECADAERLDAVAEGFLRRTDGDPDPSVVEFVLERADGGTRTLEAKGHDYLDTGSITGHVVSVRDVTGRERRKHELAEYERIVETAPIGLATVDPDGRITWANEVYAETLDVPRDELVGTPFLDLIEAGYYDEAVVEDYLESVRRLLSSSSDVDRESYVVRTHLPDGETLVHDVHIALMPTVDGEFDGTVSAFRDVTTQRAYERELERQNERLDAFASVVSHDIRNPLSVAEAYLDVAVETGDPDALETVADAHGRIDALVEDLLTLARNGRTVEDPTPTEVAVVARQAWATVETDGATLAVADDVGTVLSDPVRLQQGFENLFRNAVEHGSTSNRAEPDDSVEHGSTSSRTQSGDAVEPVEIDGGEEDEAGADLTVTVGPLDGGRGFFVADDGGGIPADEHERVFEHGYTTDPDGTGFGLAIVETIAEAHGWSVATVESEDGGARFEIAGVERVD